MYIIYPLVIVFLFSILFSLLKTLKLKQSVSLVITVLVILGLNVNYYSRNHIKFLDDEVSGNDIVGKCSEAHKLRHKFPCAFVAIGDNKKREEYAEYLKRHHFLIPSLVAPSAFISSNAKIGEGTVIMPQTNLGAVVVRSFCIVSSGSTIGSGVEIGDYSRIDSGAIVPKGDDVPEGTWVRSGEIYHNNSEMLGYNANSRNTQEVI